VKRLLPLFLLLAGCKLDGPPDGYEFGKAEYVQTDLQVKVVLVHNRDELLKLAPAAARAVNTDSTELMAYGTLSKDHKSCTIYFMDARSNYQPEWMGHELAHCIYGRWHP
jgi:hypothetical protein